MTVIPAALLLAAYFIYRVKYTITEESYEAMVRDIAVSYTHLDVYKRQVSAIFRCVFSLLPMRLYDGTPGAGARVKWRFCLIYPAQFILIPLLGMRLAS